MNKDLECVYACALRYCFGRQTYMPSLIIDEIEKVWDEFSESSQLRMIQEICQSIEDGRESKIERMMYEGFLTRVVPPAHTSQKACIMQDEAKGGK